MTSIFSHLKRRNALDPLKKYPLPAAEITQFQQFVRQAQDHELYRVNPRYVAQQLDWPLQRTLDFLILAAAENLVAFEWEVYCPVCDGLLQHTDEFHTLESHRQCPMCHNETDIHLDSEVTPRVSAQNALRALHAQRRDQEDFRTQIDQTLGRLPALQLVNRSLFREKLGEQILPANTSLGVQHLAIFFSDLKASTQLYQALGDAAAYQLVRRHFELVFAAVERHGGSAVKTIGDGVMGTFSENTAALRGVLESVRDIQTLNQEAGLSGEQQLRLKVGLNAGACIVVTLNNRLDYFGSTVNIAARLSDLAEGDDIWLAQTLLDDPEVQQIAADYACEKTAQLRLRGIHHSVAACQLAL